ncbi:inactive serine/threonine-protein kinase TEX14-like isoform X2 [Leucoraja erinacea]|uniref:inactive serine/threonine-protein kinase TEX14-like isoform X2 n=1 Tax=Leucoraja erinaceus TaxID=7782 RepID=UPI0024586B37|nr:inactive serine/threonine-protein kinase TEX14-like isoform X2 [Leucoraja erinacea]
MSHLVPLPVPCPVNLGTMKVDASGSELHHFVREGSHTKVKKILKKGAAVDTKNSLGQTPLFIAALLDLVKVVDILMVFGADPNHRCDDLSTPVHAAAFSCNQWILSKLLDAGGDLRLSDKDGRLPQVWAKSARKECSARILEFMQKCAAHMQEITQQVSCGISYQIGCSETLTRNLSMLNKITYGIKDGEFLNNPKARRISSQTVQCFGFGKFCVHGPTQMAYLASIPLVSEKALVQPDDEPTFSYANGPYTTMTNLTWNGIRVTVKQMNIPTHQNCSKRLSADLLIAEQEYNSHLRHPNFLLLMAVCQLSELDQIRLVFERINLGSLYGVLHERRSEFPVLPLETIVQMILQITDALLYIHSRGYIHRTVTSHAVQLVLPGIAKLSNFEFMVMSGDGSTQRNLSQFPIPPQFYNWLAPEVIRSKTATIKSDVYSLCTLIQELFTDAVPWEDLDGFAIKELLAAGHYLAVDEQVPKPYYDIVQIGIQVKSQNRTMNLQDIRFILRNDIKDLISNQQKHAFEKDRSEVQHLYDFVTNNVDHRTEHKQLQKENADRGKQPKCLDQTRTTAANHEYSYYNMGRRTSFSPKKYGPEDKIRHSNNEPSQQIMVLYDCWKTEQNQPEVTARSGGQGAGYIEDKPSHDSTPWKKIEQHHDSESPEPQPENYYTDVLDHLHELDLALEEEMYVVSDEEGGSIISLKTAREYTSDEEDEQSDGTTSLSQDWSRMEGLESDQEKHDLICLHTRNSSAMEEDQDIATSISVQHSISSCEINIQTSKHLVQQAFSALDHVKKSYHSAIGTEQTSEKVNLTGDSQLLEKTPCTKLLGYDEVDYQRQNVRGNKRIKSSNEGHLVIPVAVAPPTCYELPVYVVERRPCANSAEHFKSEFEVLSHTQDEQTAITKGCSSDVLKTSETFADGTQTTCSLRKQMNDEHVGYKSACDESFTCAPDYTGKLATKSKKKMNILGHVHKKENYPARKGRISMRIPSQGNQQGSRKQCMYLSSKKQIRITQSCNIVPEGVKVRQEKNTEVSRLTNAEKTHNQNYGRALKGTSAITSWTSDMTDMIEKMASGCLPVGQGDPNLRGRPHTGHVDEEELFRSFAKLPRKSEKHPQPSKSHLVNSMEGHLNHRQTKCHLHKTPDKKLIDSDSSLEIEESSQSGTGQRESFDSQQSGCGEEELNVTNLDRTFITSPQKKAQKEKVQSVSTSESSFNKSDEFFTPNPELVSRYSETSTNGNYTENQFTKESTSSEEELEITAEDCQKNTISFRSSSGSDIDVVGKGIIGKALERKNSNRDWSGISKLSFTSSAGSFSDIRDLSCIPHDMHFMNKLSLSKTPLCTGGPINNSTPYSVNTGNVPSGYCPHHTRFESLLSKIIDTSLWHSPESSMISPGTFATACDETSKIHNPTSLPDATSVISIAKSPGEGACGQLKATPTNLTTHLTEKAQQMPEDISAESIVQKLVEDQNEKIVPARLQDISQDTLDYSSDCGRCRLQKSMEETERAHSTLDSVLEMVESRDHTKEETITKHAPGEEALCMLQKKENNSTTNQINTIKTQGEVTEDSGSKTSATSVSTAVAGCTSEEISNKKPIQRANWTQPHRVIVLE